MDSLNVDTWSPRLDLAVDRCAYTYESHCQIFMHILNSRARRSLRTRSPPSLSTNFEQAA